MQFDPAHRGLQYFIYSNLCGQIFFKSYIGNSVTLLKKKAKFSLFQNISHNFTIKCLLVHRQLSHKANKNKCIVSHLHPCLFQGLRKNDTSAIRLAGMRRFSAFSQFVKHLSRTIRSGIKLHLKLYLFSYSDNLLAIKISQLYSYTVSVCSLYA